MERAILLLAVAALAGGCGSGGSRNGEGPIPIVATIFPVADLVRNVGGELVFVTVFLPPGASPHTFDPRPSQIRDISEARVFFQIGAGLEQWSERIAFAAGNPEMEIISLSDGLELICSSGHNNCGHDHGGANPHVWLDPAYAMQMVERVASTLSKIDSAGAPAYRKNAQAYILELQALDETIRETVSGFDGRRYIAFHPAWAYFSKRYGLEAAGIIEETPGKEATPRHLERIVAAIRSHGIRVVFAEPQLNPKEAEVIARETGAGVAFLDPLGGERLEGRDSYLALMRYNLREMEKVLGK